ncbi:MAG TPA: heavy metal sensor histidine kinase [Candidatus Acidoferrum sp.]|nr:heavy metal sensor histidine kinase [Candidatus Acidoferrum sp.]
MLDSVRVRLTLWYTAVLAVVLIVLSLITYFIFWRSTLQRTDLNLSELSEAFLTTLDAEVQDQSGPDSLKLAGQVAITEHRFRDHIFAIFDATGKIVVSSQDVPPAAAATGSSAAGPLSSHSFQRFLDASSHSERFFGEVKGGEDGYRGFARHFTSAGKTHILIILQSLHPQQEMLEEVASTFLWVIPIAIVLASVGGYFLARKSLAPVVAMSRQAGRIGAANLHERLAVQNDRDELGQLAQSFNSLLDRLSQSFERQRRFMADASHELRTPVAILRGEAEVALSQQARSLEEYRESLGVLHQEAERLTHIVEDLFTLTRADAGQYPLQPRDFYLDELVGECVHSARTLASAKRISLNFEEASESPIHADESLLRRMILNLLDNAIKYTSEGGRVTVTCRRAGGEYVLSITDTGGGIPAEQQPRIFERFFRVDKARSRAENDGGGAGLGLSISRWIAEAHHGRLELTRSDSIGSTFTAYLPAAPSPSASSG